MASTSTAIKIPGTTPFDGEQAKKGYALNKMCFSFNTAENRAAFKQDEEAYMKKYNLTEPQAAAIRARNVLQLIAAPTEQLRYQAKAPVNVAHELVNQWFDDFYHPTAPQFAATTDRSSAMPTVMKKRPSSTSRNGLMSSSTW